MCARGGLYNLLKLEHLRGYLVVAGLALNAGINCLSMPLMVGARRGCGWFAFAPEIIVRKCLLPCTAFI